MKNMNKNLHDQNIKHKKAIVFYLGNNKSPDDTYQSVDNKSCCSEKISETTFETYKAF
jgi:hypothetical protein